MEPMIGALGAGMDLESQRLPLDECPLPVLFIAIGSERCRRTALGGDECRRERRAADVPSDPAAVAPRSVSVSGTAPADRSFPSISLILDRRNSRLLGPTSAKSMARDTDENAGRTVQSDEYTNVRTYVYLPIL